jgi:epoxyqueuosine reductase
MSDHPAAGLAQELKSQAHRLGFCLAGITTPGPPESYPKFKQWVQDGLHAGMGYLGTERSLERRQDPRIILPECQSIVVLGIPCFPPDSSGGSVAAYAMGEDYHDTLKPLLEQLVAFLEEETGQTIPNRWYTDTGPIIERDLARRAGLGWIGKNSMLINPQHGSTFLLAEILLGIELPPDPPFTADHCGSCTRCLQACPTSCIRSDRTLDASRCISYLTIENKGPISPDLRPLLSEWIFGCDVCQQVCPWNRFAGQEGYPAFAARPGFPPDDLGTEFELTPEAFNRKFKGTPVKRSKRRGYLRNIAVVLGGRRRKEDIPALAQALKDPEPLVRRHAAWALGEIGGADALAVLKIALDIEKDPDVIQEIKAAIENMIEEI